MTLPNNHLAAVEERKITGYLLNPAHPDNGGKAQFFTAMGFTTERWNLLADALGTLARNGNVVQTFETLHGSKFVVDGTIDGPSKTQMRLRSVWIVDRGVETPRLVTAYPHG